MIDHTLKVTLETIGVGDSPDAIVVTIGKMKWAYAIVEDAERERANMARMVRAAYDEGHEDGWNRGGA